ncbi:hypothetical protein PMIN06_007831 [Paraphaeosphaeria minitans]
MYQIVNFTSDLLSIKQPPLAMRFLNAVIVVASLCSPVFPQSWVASRFYDAASGITYSSVTMPNGVSYRLALPIDSPNADGIVQVVAPSKYGWCGFAWGGRMTGNPLTVAWPSKAANGEPVTVSNRWATGYSSVPTAYTGASHTYLPISPSTINSTHWTVTSRCQGCTRWGTTNIEAATSVTFAYACSTVAPSNPASNTSSFSVHESPGRWAHDLTIAKNGSFATWVG